MPDFFDGKPADISWYPPDNEEKGKKLGEYVYLILPEIQYRRGTERVSSPVY